jgi:hypothetical protein
MIPLAFAQSKAQTGADISEFPVERVGNINLPEVIEKKINMFFDTIIEGETVLAFRELMRNSPLKEKEDEIGNLISETKKSFELYGKLLGYEAVEAEYITGSYMRLKYLGLNEKYPTRWMITFYKSPSQGWMVTNIKFDDLAEYFFSD